jgi:hypothetical protein
MKKRFGRTVFVVGMAALCSVLAAEAQTRLWSVSLKAMGWQDPYARFAKSAGMPKDFDLGTVVRNELAVGDDGQVSTGFGILAQAPAPAKTLRVAVLDGKNGALLRLKDYPTPMLNRTAVMNAADGTLLVVAMDKVLRVNADGAIEESVPLPTQPEINPGLWITESPSGKTLLMTTDEKTFRFVRTDTLATVAECASPEDELDELSDDLTLSMADSPQGFGLHIGKFCAPMAPLWSLQNGHTSDVRLIGDSDLLEVTLSQIHRITLKNKPVWSWTPPGKAVPFPIAGIALSQSGGRVAIPLVVYRQLPPTPCHDVCPIRQMSGGTPQPVCVTCPGMPNFEKMFPGIVVLDAGSGRQIAIVPLRDADSSQLALALSPDGHKLAVLNKDVVELWSF